MTKTFQEFSKERDEEFAEEFECPDRENCQDRGRCKLYEPDIKSFLHEDRKKTLEWVAERIEKMSFLTTPNVPSHFRDNSLIIKSDILALLKEEIKE